MARCRASKGRQQNSGSHPRRVRSHCCSPKSRFGPSLVSASLDRSPSLPAGSHVHWQALRTPHACVLEPMVGSKEKGRENVHGRSGQTKLTLRKNDVVGGVCGVCDFFVAVSPWWWDRGWVLPLGILAFLGHAHTDTLVPGMERVTNRRQSPLRQLPPANARTPPQVAPSDGRRGICTDLHLHGLPHKDPTNG